MNETYPTITAPEITDPSLAAFIDELHVFTASYELSSALEQDLLAFRSLRRELNPDSAEPVNAEVSTPGLFDIKRELTESEQTIKLCQESIANLRKSPEDQPTDESAEYSTQIPLSSGRQYGLGLAVGAPFNQ